MARAGADAGLLLPAASVPDPGTARGLAVAGRQAPAPSLSALNAGLAPLGCPPPQPVVEQQGPRATAPPPTLQTPPGAPGPARGRTPRPGDLPTIGELGQLYEALAARESSGGSDRRDGDNGASRGPLQTQERHWGDSGVPLPYEPWVRERAVAEIETYLWWLRFCPEALRERDLEKLARYHNGGPDGWAGAQAGEYWQDICGRMAAAQAPPAAEVSP